MSQALAIPKQGEYVIPEFRDFVKRIRCVVCQASQGMTIDGEYIDQDLEYVPEIEFVSDPSHVVSRGAGGADEDNIVPMCRQHHNEYHQLGTLSFQTRYNINLPEIATDIYRIWLREEDRKADYEEGVKLHREAIERINRLRRQTLELGQLLLEFSEKKINGRPLYECMGFTSMQHYIQTPIESGGLGLAGKTMYRWLHLADLKRELPDVPVENMGAVKADYVLPLVKAAKTDEEKLQVYQAFEPLTQQDAISEVHKRRGTEDPRQRRHRAVKSEIELFLDSVGVEWDEHAVDSVAWRIMNLLNR